MAADYAAGKAGSTGAALVTVLRKEPLGARPLRKEPVRIELGFNPTRGFANGDAAGVF
jgi:hypothetical protein